MTAVDVSLTADIRAVLGAPGTGKSHYTKAAIKKDRRLLVWAPDDEYPELQPLRLDQIAAAFYGRNPLRAKFICSMNTAKRAAQFDVFCRTVFAVGYLRLVIEELRFVTRPSYSPEGWASITLMGRKRGIKTIGTSQRPAQIDKDFLASCNTVRVGALEYPEDRKAVAPILRKTVEEIAALSGYQALEYRRK